LNEISLFSHEPKQAHDRGQKDKSKSCLMSQIDNLTKDIPLIEKIKQIIANDKSKAAI
jgi:hypothetical protein